MSIFSSIAKFLLYTLIATIIYFSVFDFGNSFVASSKNYYIARNAGTFVTKFSVDPEKLQNFEQGALDKGTAIGLVEDYFTKQYENQGFELKRSSSVGLNRHIMEFYPTVNDTKEGHSFAGPIFVRSIYYGFPGTPVSPYGGQDGLILLNVEQKIPMSLYRLYGSYSQSNPNYDKLTEVDFEGFSGYYSIVSDYPFSINVVK